MGISEVAFKINNVFPSHSAVESRPSTGKWVAGSLMPRTLAKGKTTG